jgi:hypothetical protein
MSYQCCALPIEKAALTHYGRQLGVASPEQALTHLAQAITLHPMWQAVSQGMVIARTYPSPVLAVLGTFTTKHLGQIQVQQPSLNEACRRLQYVNYASVTATCEKLAEQLLETFGHRTLKELHFYGIPRGGVIVLGMLAYVLNLSSEQISPPYPDDGPLVVVDDCALSGSRLFRQLHHCSQPELIFAPLYAHPELRRAILAAEPRIIHCLSGEDLYDHGPDLMGADYKTWQTQNRARLAGRRYWLGLPDYICFPWNEPDHLLWNPVSAQLEQSWPIIPPALCLKNRPRYAALPVQVQPKVQGWLQPSHQAVFGELKGQVLIGHLQTGETFGLSGKAAEFWRVILQAPTRENAIATLVQQCQTPDAQIRAELNTFLEQLRHQNILAPAL